MLMTETPQVVILRRIWYSATFGRDGLITALQMLWVDPRIAARARQLAFFRPSHRSAGGRRTSKILHDARRRNAALREASRNTTAASIHAAVRPAGRSLCRRTGDEQLPPSCGLRSKRRCNGSMARGPDDDGFVEYRRASELGLPIRAGRFLRRHLPADGELAEGHIAAEVRGIMCSPRNAGGALAPGLGSRHGEVETERSFSPNG
jgi:hypothetical protein